ncbi:glycosyltransferase family 4 protein [Brenneria izbisi]|uniref:Glycosyltransferase family 4 protein n=1 Tax=Brenneria izbisi TaxID=2939450 RepID=A0AA41Y2M8_9GAMM|nr:glycosyltransferase family 4 protein [Brenneria izbisi]MCV9878281.1 glycosyltransferase family 4 protein [Brenneria izbisi]MCV9881704.1 glycosyltransferase family 4 protein [Brenneria izbisi]
MRIAYICTDPGIPVFGCKGASIHIQEVLRSLLKAGAEITLFAQRIGGEPPADLAAIHLHRLPALPNDTAQLRAQAALAANDVLHQALAGYPPFDAVYERYALWSDAGMAYARQTGCKGILEVNAPLIEEQKRYRTLPLEAQALRILHSVLTNADLIVAVSPGIKAYLMQFPPTKQKVHVVANGVDPLRFGQAITIRRERQTHHSQRETVIGFLGTLKPWHGVDTLIDAFALLYQRGNPVRLLIVGDGPEYASLSDRVERQGLSDWVHFTGALPHTDIPARLAEMDIAVAPYPALPDFYFSPLKIYEYMAAGLPVITTQVGHLEQIVVAGETGMVVAPDNPPALCGALETLVADHAWRCQLGANGRQSIIQNQSWDAVVQQIFRLADLVLPEG